MNETKLLPDYLFEISWEVCNKVGGIYTVISTKAKSLSDLLNDRYILIGPDVWKESHQYSEFIEDKFLFSSWQRQLEVEGLKCKVGRWNIAGSPVAILVDFTAYFSQKDKIFYEFWESHRLDSLSGQWDYIEPALFGYASARIIQSFYDFFITAQDKVLAHFHEWMTGTGVLYLNKHVPQIGTIFTTHATVVGRSIAGNKLPLYTNIAEYKPEEFAQKFNITSKFSLEKLSATNADAFTVVSQITNLECEYFLGKKADIITPNGFEDTFVPKHNEFIQKRAIARRKLKVVTEALTNIPVEDDAIFIANSGRYEFHNKGIDVFIDSIAQLNNDNTIEKPIYAFILVPANHAGPRTDIIENIHNADYLQPIEGNFLTHRLHEEEFDPILNRIKEKGIHNNAKDKVKLFFVPCYLDGADGIFNLSYYDLLIGFDLTVFPSYYEPWGYTPLESLAFHIPTITTNLAGFGLWIQHHFNNYENSVYILERTDDNYNDVINQCVYCLKKFLSLTDDERIRASHRAYEIAQQILWEKLIHYYLEAFSIALSKSKDRYELYKDKKLPDTLFSDNNNNNKPQWKKILVKSYLPDALIGLREMSQNLWWSWNYDAQEMFESIDSQLWRQSGKNPIVLLESLSLEQYKQLCKNNEFLSRYEEVYQKFKQYLSQKPDYNELIAYFSMEYGINDTLKIYSGGLGVLAGDYLKQASDSCKAIVGVGLLYRYGYFTQSLSVNGEQIAMYLPQKFTHMPVLPVRNEKGEWLMISLPFPGRTVFAKIWEVKVGRVSLYLLDTDIDENHPDDKSITYQLYGGDNENRLKQEILLGIGGIKMLELLGLTPKLYHCNEGHAAFIGLERLRRLIEVRHLSFNEALEVVRATTLFTTHTPVPAGHDTFSEDLIRTYLSYYADKFNISWDAFIGLGRINETDTNEKFSMSVLACKLSQEVNGVSRIHGKVSRKMFQPIWNNYFPEELHINYVTNGVHFPTWVAKPWLELYRKYLPETFISEQSNAELWKNIETVPNEEIWNIRKKLKEDLFVFIRKRLMENIEIRQENPKFVLELMEKMNDNVLTIGFARRFATYKRAYLLFSDLNRLSRLVNHPQYPMIFIFAGKAHPADKAGQDLIKMIYEVSHRPEFVGKILFLENYDMELATKLVQGVDIWLNTPTRPLEASGTSGEKAIMNGVVNVSVLDGWWAEGYVKGAGWALKEEATYTNQTYQDNLDAETLYFLFENEIAPTYYQLNEQNIPIKWIQHIKKTIASIVPHFTMKRMLDEYYSKFYQKMFERREILYQNQFEKAKHIAAWKLRILRSWDSIEVVEVKIPDSTQKPLKLGDDFVAEITLNLHEIKPNEIGIEVLFGQKEFDEIKDIIYIEKLQPINEEKGIVTYSCRIPTIKAGVFDYAFRIYPTHHLLPHRMDFPLVKWI
ncbi:MAG: alpha-glucan family phosphorylase [Bacteroidales bacterium]|nr:alpha-glucan family phosphorylase [Bacteroidales bacterium]